MMKKVRRVSMESSPSSSSYPVGEEARARFKHQSLMQDYEELLKETVENKKKLHRISRKKLKLLAEVKFLQIKYKSLSKNPSQKFSCKLKKQSRKIPSQLAHAIQPHKPDIRSQVPSKDRNCRERDAALPSTSAVLDLNQISLPNGEEMEEFQVEWEPPTTEKSKRYLMEGDPMVNDLKPSICRDVGNGSNRVGKRKISWQDQTSTGNGN